MFEPVVIFGDQNLWTFGTLSRRVKGDERAVERVQRVDFLHSQATDPRRNLIEILVSN